MSNQQPAVGRIVHYVAYGTPGGEYPAGAHRAAIITEVVDGGTGIGIDSIGLCVLNPTGIFFHQRVAYDATGTQPGTWHWPQFVPPRATTPEEAGAQMGRALARALRALWAFDPRHDEDDDSDEEPLPTTTEDVEEQARRMRRHLPL